jgi:hypothetical protein
MYQGGPAGGPGRAAAQSPVASGGVALGTLRVWARRQLAMVRRVHFDGRERQTLSGQPGQPKGNPFAHCLRCIRPSEPDTTRSPTGEHVKRQVPGTASRRTDLGEGPSLRARLPVRGGGSVARLRCQLWGALTVGRRRLRALRAPPPPRCLRSHSTPYRGQEEAAPKVQGGAGRGGCWREVACWQIAGHLHLGGGSTKNQKVSMNP